MKKNLYFFIVAFCSYSFFLCSCGSANVYSSAYKKNEKQKAEDEISKGNYDDAIVILNQYLQENSKDYMAQSMLANAYMHKGDIDLLTIIMNVSNNVGKTKNDFYTVIKSFPAGNLTNISYIGMALQALSAIPSSSKTAEQIYQTAIANAALALFTIKIDCIDSQTGLISTSQTTNISATDVTIIYNSLVNVQTLLNSIQITPGTNSGSGILLGLVNQLTATTGGTPAIILANFLITNA